MEEVLEKIELNEEQLLAVESIIDFIDNGNKDEWFTLKGKAGTGKTTIISEVLKKYINQKRIIISALSHKAKRVLKDKVVKSFKQEDNNVIRGVNDYSVASMLAMKFDLETGVFTSDGSRKEPQLKYSDIVIVDECSMINETSLELIMEKKKNSAKVIFVGDVGQLPPIRNSNDIELIGKPSPTFETKNEYTLTERVRQGSDSTILKYSDYYWDNSVTSENVEEDPIPFSERMNNENMEFPIDLEKTINDNIGKFRELKDIKNIDLIKVVVYKNETRQMLNWYIRKLIFDEPKEYELGDVIIFNDNYTAGKEDIIISNSTEVSVKSVKKGKFYKKFDGYILNVTDGRHSWNVDVLSETSKKDYGYFVAEKFIKCREMPKGRGRNLTLKKAWSYKQRFADIDFGYCLTSHKAQGSTYDTVIVVEDDILSVNPITDIEKSQSLYVAISRASNKVYVVSNLNK